MAGGERTQGSHGYFFCVFDSRENEVEEEGQEQEEEEEEERLGDLVYVCICRNCISDSDCAA